jgi:hypothetical protein
LASNHCEGMLTDSGDMILQQQIVEQNC